MRLPASPPSDLELITSIGAPRVLELVSSDIGNERRDRYLHWDEMRHRPPPDGFSREEWWLATKLARMSSRQKLPLRDKLGTPFWFSDSQHMHRRLHEIDQDASGRIQVPAEDMASTATRERYVIRSLVEEAITSSQLEGAATTRVVAKEMLRSGRSPRDADEQMILNNYRAMEFIRAHSDVDLTVEMLLELQRMLTDKTLDAAAVGRFRRPSDNVHVVDMEENILHTPPHADELDQRLAGLLSFANRRGGEEFVHPAVRAILLHFMIGYDHPFVDGNGRTARALFYWSMARSGYWLMEFVSISQFIRKSYPSYGRAYLYSETDGGDVSYFLHYNLRIVRQCIDDLHSYLARKMKERRQLERMFSEGNLAHYLNHRQKALLAHLVKKQDTVYTIEGHRRSHGVSYHTARKDLEELAEVDLLTRRAPRGRKLLYTMNPDFARNLKDIVELLA